MSSYHRWLIVTAVIGLACCASACEASSAGDNGAGPERPFLANHAVVYACQRAHPHSDPTWVVLYQSGADQANARVVYEAAPGYGGLMDGFGFLPSPGGRWLHVWETVVGPEHGAQKTRWFVIELATGRHISVGEQPGRTGLLPYWLDDDRLCLEKGRESAVFNARTGELTGPLPTVLASIERPDQGERYIDSLQPRDAYAFEWRRVYVERHYATEMKGLRSSLDRLGTAWGVTPYRTAKWPDAESPETFLLRPLGVVRLYGWRSLKTNWPSVAVSPLGDLIARSAMVRPGMIHSSAPASSERAAPGNPRGVFRARLDVYDLPLGNWVWGTEIPGDLTRTDSDVFWDFPNATDPWFGAIRWSSDGWYLSFTSSVTLNGQRTANATVVDTRTWQQVLTLPDARNLFVVPAVDQTAESVR